MSNMFCISDDIYDIPNEVYGKLIRELDLSLYSFMDDKRNFHTFKNNPFITLISTLPLGYMYGTNYQFMYDNPYINYSTLDMNELYQPLQKERWKELHLHGSKEAVYKYNNAVISKYILDNSPILYIGKKELPNNLLHPIILVDTYNYKTEYRYLDETFESNLFKELMSMY